VQPHEHQLTWRDPIHRRSFARWLDVAARLAAGVVAASAGALWLFCAYLVLSFRFAPAEATDPGSPAFDPHGFGLIFGAVLSLPVGLVWATALPLVFARGRRGRVAAWATPALLVLSAALLAVWWTA
jgi:hypothetical protein